MALSWNRRPASIIALRTVADEGVQPCNRDGRQPDQPERMIGRSRQVGRRVDQRAVEIENDCRACEMEGHGGRSVDWLARQAIRAFAGAVIRARTCRLACGPRSGPRQGC